MIIKHIIGAVTVLLFIAYFCIGTRPRKSYLLFVLYFFPTMDLSITSEPYGSFTIFDTISYFTLLYLIKDFLYSKYYDVYSILFITLISIIFLGSINAEFPKVSIVSLVKMISIFIYAKLLLDEIFSNSAFLKSAIDGLKFSAISSIVFLGIQSLIGLKFTFYTDLNQNIFDSNMIRYPGYFQDPQVYAQFLSMVVFIFFIKETKEATRSLKKYIPVLVIIPILFLTGGRAGFIAMCVGMSIIVLSSGLKNIVYATACGLLCYLLMSGFSESGFFNRQESLGEALLVRNKIWNEALEIFRSHPLIGIGIENYRNHIALHSISGYYIIDNEIVYYGTESGYLKILVEIGILGLLISFCIILKPILDGLRSVRQAGNNFNIIFLIAGILSWATGFISLYTLSDKRILILLATLLCLLIHASKTKNGYNV
jgi:O-antigen ligase